ncbi:hypothetical protein [Bradyrhizobium embrapense]|uniref:hypothetical protein n=1 Tax=Bradyrhizobium embrapense TaxID=630921 RepID=UPI000A62479D|nr:hypothetical protein [Bradyrhizobium embrapense]
MTSANTEGKSVMPPQIETYSSDEPGPRAMTAGSWTIVTVLLLLLAGTLVIAVLGWSSGSGADVPASGYVALALGVLFSLAVGFGLMGLVFYSSRGGYDEPPLLLPAEKTDDNRPQPGAAAAALGLIAEGTTRNQSSAKKREQP